MKREDTVKGLNMNMQLTPTRVAVQCTDEVFEQSKNSGSMMIHRDLEIIAHDSIKVNGEEIDIKGREVPQYLVTKKSDGKGGFLPPDHSDNKKAMGRVYEEYDKDGFSVDEIDENNPVLMAKGKVFDAMVSTEAQPKRNAPTPEQIAKGQRIGDIVLDANGKPEQIFRLKLNYILGPSQVAPLPF